MEQRPRSSDSSPVPAVAGVKRPATEVPALLPAFEPLSSSPPLPRPAKRVARDPGTAPSSPLSAAAWRCRQEHSKYPTPVPTSSTGIVSSSPPRVARRPGLQRTASTLSERAPLASVPSIELDASGTPTLMGRSGKAATYHLSTNKLISRVHVRAAYVPADPPHPAKVELVCMGWNGIKIHCQGKAWELAKGDTFTSESQDADIMLDVQDSRVLLQWPRAPRKAHTPATTDSGGDEENSPRRGVVRRATIPSPLRARPRLASPVSPTPAGGESLAATAASLFGPPPSDPPPIQIYEDSPSPDEASVPPPPPSGPTQSTVHLSQPGGTQSGVSIDESADEADDGDADEENDPLVHSFSAAGDNLLSRMASVQASGTPRADPLADLALDATDPALAPLVNHVVNQLAFARVASTPLSTLMSHLPASLTAEDPAVAGRPLTRRTLRALCQATACVGVVAREGKDAAGQPLESEYYYLPDHDWDASRRAAVVDGLQKPGLRSCRKSHKQYYWKKPR